MCPIAFPKSKQKKSITANLRESTKAHHDYDEEHQYCERRRSQRRRRRRWKPRLKQHTTQARNKLHKLHTVMYGSSCPHLPNSPCTFPHSFRKSLPQLKTHTNTHVEPSAYTFYVQYGTNSPPPPLQHPTPSPKCSAATYNLVLKLPTPASLPLRTCPDGCPPRRCALCVCICTLCTSAWVPPPP